MRLSFFQPKSKPKPKRIFPVTPLPDIKEFIIPHIPDQAFDAIAFYLGGHSIHFRVTRQRHTKSGDFRPAQHGSPARITINGTLNPYAFLLTLIHEIAHLHCEENLPSPVYRRKKRDPHGIKWKSVFQNLMAPLLIPSIFPDFVLGPLAHHMKNPKASATSDPALSRALKEYDQPSGGVHLEELAAGSLFSLHNGKLFRKQEKLRKRYKCISVDDGRVYLISPVAVVFPSPDPSSL